MSKNLTALAYIYVEGKMVLFSKDLFACIGNVQREKLAGYLQIYIRQFGCCAGNYLFVEDESPI